MAKFHITPKGEAGPCSARFACPYGGEENHFTTREEARDAYEARMTAELMPNGVAGLGKREMNKIAAITSDNDVIEKALKEGSDATLRALAKNPHIGMHQLVGAYNSTTDATTRAALTRHERFPVGKMSGDELVNAIPYRDHDELLKDDGINDEHIGALEANGMSNHRPGLGYPIRYALANPRNKLSEAKLVELAEKNWGNMGAALRSNRYPTDRIVEQDEGLVYWGNINNLQSPAYLDGYADWAIKNRDNVTKREEAGRYVAKNPYTAPVTLHKLVQNDVATTFVLDNPNVSDETRQLAAQKNPEAARMLKIAELDSKFEGGVLKHLTKDRATVQPYANRGLHDTTIELDVAKVKELGLSKDDVNTMLGASNYNGGAYYNEETGVFKGTVDSTD